MIFSATLAFVSRDEEPSIPPELADLDADEVDFLERHVAALRSYSIKEEAQRSKFQRGADTKTLFEEMLTATPSEFAERAGIIMSRLVTQMRASTTPKPGILAVIASGESAARYLSVLKLEAIHEAAEFERRARGGIKLKVLRELLPGPGDLKKGISWPDPRRISDAVVQDTNIVSAQYFFNACQLNVSAKAGETEREAFDVLVREVPRSELATTLAAVANYTGTGDGLIKQIKERVPEVKGERKALGVGGLAGPIRGRNLLAKKLRLTGDGIDILIPVDQFDRVSEPVEQGGRWIVTVTFDSPPELKS